MNINETGSEMKSYVFLFLSICCEVIATTALKASDSFTRLWPSIIVVIFYATAFYFLTIPMRTLPTGVIYAIWSGAGIVFIGLISWVFMVKNLTYLQWQV